MAKVEMDLAELDKMRDKIKGLEIDKQTLKAETQKILDAQPRVTIHHKSYKGTVKGGPNIRNHNIQIYGLQVISRENGGCCNEHRTPSYMPPKYTAPIYEYQNIDKMLSFAELEKQGILEVDMQEQHGETSRDYKNFDSVIEEIRAVEIGKVETRMNILTKRAQDNAEKLAIVENNYEDKLAKLQQEKEKGIKGCLDQLQEAEESYRANTKLLQQQYEDLKINKNRIALEEEIERVKKLLTETKTELNLTKSKLPFWKR